MAEKYVGCLAAAAALLRDKRTDRQTDTRAMIYASCYGRDQRTNTHRFNGRYPGKPEKWPSVMLSSPTKLTLTRFLLVGFSTSVRYPDCHNFTVNNTKQNRTVTEIGRSLRFVVSLDTLRIKYDKAGASMLIIHANMWMDGRCVQRRMWIFHFVKLQCFSNSYKHWRSRLYLSSCYIVYRCVCYSGMQQTHQSLDHQQHINKGRPTDDFHQGETFLVDCNNGPAYPAGCVLTRSGNMAKDCDATASNLLANWRTRA